jgi:hypothetical protein
MVEQDIVADFCARLDMPRLPPVDTLSNPSISGNLLYFKLLLNFLDAEFAAEHRKPLYRATSALALQHKPFSGRFKVNEATMAHLRAYSYNRVVEETLNVEIPLKDFSAYPEIFNPETFAADLERMRANPLLDQAADRIQAMTRFISEEGRSPLALR